MLKTSEKNLDKMDSSCRQLNSHFDSSVGQVGPGNPESTRSDSEVIPGDIPNPGFLLIPFMVLLKIHCKLFSFDISVVFPQFQKG